MTAEDIDPADLAAILEKSPDYRVLRRLAPRTERTAGDAPSAKIGILLDVETTGLDTASTSHRARHGQVRLSARRHGHGVVDVFSALNQPSAPIPPDISELTGITDATVAGHRIDAEAVAAFAADSVIVIAHNAHFDRKFAERYWPVFQQKLGAARRPKSNGASTALTDRASVISWPAPACSIRPIAPSTIAMRCWKFWRPNCPAPAGPRWRRCWIAPAATPAAFGPSNRRSISRTN